MRKVALVIAVALTVTAPAVAQDVNPPPPPGAAPSGGPPPPAARPRRGAMQAPDFNLAACDQGSPQDIRKCKAKNVAMLQRAIGRKVVETCQKQLGVTGTRGPAAADERLACRYDLLTKLLDSLK
jgi:hypothetical protein